MTEHTQILARERQLYDAMVEEDLAKLDELLAGASSYVHSNGVEEDKAGYLKGVRDGLYEYDRVDSSDVVLHIDGPVAVETGRTVMVVGERGRPKGEVRLLTTLVWVREAGTWRLLRRHATRLP